MREFVRNLKNYGGHCQFKQPKSLRTTCVPVSSGHLLHTFLLEVSIAFLDTITAAEPQLSQYMGFF